MMWTVWAVEDSAFGAEVFDITSHTSFEEAFASATEEVSENGAAICAYITGGQREDIWYAIDGITKRGGYLGAGVTSWRDALRQVAA